MAGTESPANIPENKDVSTRCPITNSLPLGFPWPLGSQSLLDGFAFWYRPDPVHPMPRRQHGLKNRPSGSHRSDAIKHTRTRNGCFTCRNRRVKCDEARPICDRCRKGNRQCKFPPPSKPSKRKSKPGGDQPASRSTAGTPEDDDGLFEAPGKAEDQGKQDHVSVGAWKATARDRTVEDHDRLTPRRQPARESGSISSASKEKTTSSSAEEWESTSASITPSSSLREGTIPSSSTISPPGRNHRPMRWTHLPADLQKYLLYQRDSMTYHHYFFKLDPNDFLHTDFIDLALEDDSLLYAAVAFAAYHHAVARPDGELSQFLGYYSKAVSLLRSVLENGRPQTPATLLTILQLATFEEYLGDWVHLNGHHRAAHQLLVELYNPQTILESETSRQILAWHSRLDVTTAIMAGSQTALGREWYVEFQAYYEDQIDPEDVDVENNLAAAFADARRVGMDMAALFSQPPQGSISIENVMIEGEDLAQQILHLRERIEGLNDEYYTVQEFPNQQPLTADDIVDPYRPGGLFRDAFWPLNHLWIDWYGLYQMYTLTMMAMRQQPFPPEMETLSLDQCRLFEAIERWPESPKGSLLGCHESLNIAAVFLKKDDRHITWCRRKMATVERQGYMVAPTFRRKMAEIWQQPDINHWWLPNDEGFTPLLRDIRAFSEDRISPCTDQSSERLRDISAVFSSLSV